MSVTIDRQLVIAARSGNVERLRKLVAVGADPNYIDARHGNALLAAVSAGQVDAVRALIELGASTSVTNSHGNGALEHALHARNDHMVGTLVAHGAKLQHRSRPHWRNDLEAAMKRIAAQPTVPLDVPAAASRRQGRG